MTERALRGLVVDWGGVLTPSLDEAMAAWVARDGVTFQHFEDTLRAWARQDGDRGAAAAGREGAAAAGAEGPVAAGREGAVAAGREGPVARLEESDGAGPAGRSPVHQLERGELPVARFEQVLAAELTRRGSPVQPEGLLRRMLGGLDVLQEDMLGLVRRARNAGVRTALLSNSWGDAYPERLWDGTFDAVVISCRVGMRKPEPEIFRHTCALLDLPPSACVMVDDLRHNVQGAAAAGMAVLLHTDYDKTVDELEVLLGVPLR